MLIRHSAAESDLLCCVKGFQNGRSRIRRRRNWMSIIMLFEFQLFAKHHTHTYSLTLHSL